MSTEKTNQPQSPEELAKAAQEAAIKAVMEQNQALFGNMPGYQMPDMQAMQEQIMAQMKAAAPNLDEIQAQQLAAAGIDADTLSQAFCQNMAYAREMMTGGEEVEANSWFDLTDDEWEINRMETSELTEDQLRLLALGAPILVYNGERVNTIACESELETVRNTLESWWDVTDHDSTFHIAEWLLKEGHHADADNLLQSIGSEGLERFLEDGGEMTKDGGETGKDVRLIMLTMLENEYCTEEELPRTALAWDLVRMVNLARWACLCGYISEEEMWQIMRTASDAAHKRFASWNEYGLSFIFGRGVWHGNPEDSETASEIVSVLLEKDESPWKQLAWK